MNASIWISLAALLVSISGFFYTVLINHSKIGISLYAKRNLMRVDVHETSIKLLSLINMLLNDEKTDQQIRILTKLVDTSKGLVSIYSKLNEDLSVPWIMQNMVSKSYENLSSKFTEFKRVFELAQIYYVNGELNKLEETAEGMYNRIWAGTKESEIPKN